MPTAHTCIHALYEQAMSKVQYILGPEGDITVAQNDAFLSSSTVLWHFFFQVSEFAGILN